MRTSVRRILLSLVTLTLCACSVHYVNSSPPLAQDAGWVLLPVVNLAEVPLAGEKVEAMLDNALRLRGLTGLKHPAAPLQNDTGLLLDDRQRYQAVLKVARASGARYGVTGTVNEWRYKTGLDGEPAVGLTLQLIDVASGDILWTASGAKTGWGFANVSGTAEKLIATLLGGLKLQQPVDDVAR